jgi:hypothetical protein
MKKIWYSVLSGSIHFYNSEQCINKLKEEAPDKVTDTGSFTVDGDVQGLNLENEHNVTAYLSSQSQTSSAKTTENA